MNAKRNLHRCSSFNDCLSKIIYLIFKPYVLAFFVWWLLLAVTPDYFSRYDLDIIKEERLMPQGSHQYYFDLNNDDVKELVIAEYRFPDSNHVRIQYCDSYNRIYNQWNPPGTWLPKFKIFFGDFNHNGYAEVYCLTLKSDSLVLSISELMKDGGYTTSGRFVSKVGRFQNNVIDPVNVFGELIDSDGDGYDEFVFSVYGGFSKQPRCLFRYNLISDQIVRTPVSAAGMYNSFSTLDLNGDGINEITGSVPPHENHHDQTPLSDSASWLMVVDPVTMNFVFDPVRFDYGIGSPSYPGFGIVDGKKYIIVPVFCNNAGNSWDSVPVYLFDDRGHLLKFKQLKDTHFRRLTALSPRLQQKYFLLMSEKGDLCFLDTLLNIKEIRVMTDNESMVIRGESYTLMDIERDKKPESLWLSNDAKGINYLCLLTDDMNELLQLALPVKESVFYYHFDLIHNEGIQTNILVLQANEYEYFISLHKNGLYWLKYPAWLFVYLLILLGFWILQLIQDTRARHKFEAERLLMHQQIALAKRQLEPHFMLNTLNNLGSIFMFEDKKEAQYLFGKFASLIHRGLSYSDKSESNLAEEMAFVSDYLTLQKRRFEQFEFTIRSTQEVNMENVLIPHSLVYTFVENALKHGLGPKPGPKQLDISMTMHGKKVIIRVYDDGIGRAKAQQTGTWGTGKGLSIIKNITEAFNKLNKTDIRFKIIDCNQGTEVLITI